MEDIGPDSQWFNGLPWMRLEIEEAVDTGILTPVSKSDCQTRRKLIIGEAC